MLYLYTIPVLIFGPLFFVSYLLNQKVKNSEFKIKGHLAIALLHQYIAIWKSTLHQKCLTMVFDIIKRILYAFENIEHSKIDHTIFF